MSKYKVGMITASDKGSQGLREDLSGPAIFEILSKYNEKSGNSVFLLSDPVIIPDEVELLKDAMIRMCDDEGMDLILTTGGTGFSKRDVTPEATLAVIQRRAPGISEAMRYFSLQITPRAMLSRAEAGIRNNTLIINMPGSPKAVKEVLDYILSSIEHGLDILQANDADCARP